MRILKALSALLLYPSAELREAVPEIRDVVAAEALLPPERRDALGALLDDLAGRDLYESQEAYGSLFDRSRTLSLHLFEHVHAESRDRGQAMVDLRAQYEAAGFEIDARELPDFVPLFLEYVSLLPQADARALLSDTAHILSALAERLEKRGSPYGAVFAAATALAAARPSAEALAALVEAEDIDPQDFAALDAVWEEEEVRFGPGAAAACGSDALVSKIRAGRRPAPGLEPAPARGPATLVTRSHPVRA